MVGSRMDYRALRYMAPVLMLTSLGLCAAVLVMGQQVNGARRWLGVGSLSFQPSELAKLSLAIWAAAYLARRPAPRTLKELSRPIGLTTGLFAALILLEPDLGTVIAIVFVLGAILVVSGTPLRVLGAGGSIAFGLALAAIWIEPYRRARFFSFLNPGHDPQGAGYQTVQGIMGLASGGLTGTGIGGGVFKDNYLPEAHTDMIFATIGEELGLLGATLVIAAYVVFAYAGLRVALRCRDPFGKRLAAGLTTLVCGQALINLAAVLGLAPLTGIPLPFISYGGSSLVVSLAAVGVLLNIAGHGGAARAQVPDRSRGTAGHVLPSLAVAEALVARGVKVTFAGSPDRVEARLVPEAGFELDTFRVSGLPRRPTPALARAVGQALRAPRACRRILRERKPDVVLGGGGYVAGPMVYAASRMGIPTALMEADAHLGLANRLAAPFARRVFLSFPIEGRDGPKYRVTGRPIPARNRPPSRAEGRAAFDLPPRARVLLVFGGSQGAASLNELVVETFGATGPAVLHLSGERDYERLRGRVTRARLQAAAVHRRLRGGARGRRSRRRALRRLGLGSRRRRESRRSSSRIPSRLRITRH